MTAYRLGDRALSAVVTVNERRRDRRTRTRT